MGEPFFFVATFMAGVCLRTTMPYTGSMTVPAQINVRDSIMAEYAAAQATFHTLLDSMSDDDLKRQSRNPGWKNGQILFHMTLGFMVVSAIIPLVRFWARLPKGFSKVFASILNAFTGPFNWVNGIGARGGGRFFRGKRLGRRFDKTYASMLRKLNSVKDDEWRRGMYFPEKWGGLFKKYMTLEDVFRFPTVHFRFHLDQIAR